MEFTLPVIFYAARLGLIAAAYTTVSHHPAYQEMTRPARRRLCFLAIAIVLLPLEVLAALAYLLPT
ncbi:hypothetical protein [Sagittula salina]|uniref:Uncharacterized protein n=1 Tax=Sagittula salina TaxID=2820268 RepID=A0A940RZQ3_9RHOB|nr:hypothetical protein [Sagittula salina]MBP0481232.1 hypothetical protein [Sagittula salina]